MLSLLYSIQGHTAEVLSLCFNTVGNQLVTGSFDHTVVIWDVASGRSAIEPFLSTCTTRFSPQRCLTESLPFSVVRRRVHTLIGHRGEISNVQFNWDCSLIVTGSMDKTCKVRYYQPNLHLHSHISTVKLRIFEIQKLINLNYCKAYVFELDGACH